MNPADAALAEGLFAAFRRLCESRNYDAAFHTLMAVLHIADQGEDMELVDRVAGMAAAQADEIDAIAPPHHLSTASASGRGQTPVFKMLGIHAQSIKARQRVGTGPQRTGSSKE
jgi:hypothetical protein